MPKHTPGPWTTIPVAGKYGRNKRAIGTGNYQVCEVHVGGRNGEIDETQWENAQLIAAAPELLAALKVSVQWGKACIEMTDDKWLHQAIQADIDKCNAAIAKAERADR